MHRIVGLTMVLLGFVGAAIWFVAGAPDDGNRPDEERSLGTADDVVVAPAETVAAVVQETAPQPAVAADEQDQATAAMDFGEPPQSDHPFDPGQTPLIDPDANPRVASVAAALRQGDHPERLSITQAPSAFNLAAYTADPEAYLQTVEPGRVFQAAQPGPDVPVLRALTPRRPVVKQGDVVAMQVAAPAGMPVTFTSLDLGIFTESQLTSVTVAANADGVAEVHLAGTAGTVGDVGILCASPVCSGQLRFIARVDRVTPVAD